MTNKEQALVSKGYDKDTVISLCRYNNEDLIDIVDTFINIITKNVSTSDKPICIYIGGQPGAGKSVLSHKLKRNFNAVELSMDACRMFHPNYEEMEKAIFNFYKGKTIDDSNNPGTDIATFTQDFAGNMIDMLINKISNMGYNIILEWNMRKADDVLECMRKLSKKGYKNNAAAIAISKEISLEACKVRANIMNDNGHIVRRVNEEFHQICIDSIPINVDKIYKIGMEENILNSMNVVLRNGKNVWNHNRQGLPSEVLNEYYNNIDLTSEFRNDSRYAEVSYNKESIGLIVNQSRLVDSKGFNK